VEKIRSKCKSNITSLSRNFGDQLQDLENELENAARFLSKAGLEASDYISRIKELPST